MRNGHILMRQMNKAYAMRGGPIQRETSLTLSIRQARDVSRMDVSRQNATV